MITSKLARKPLEPVDPATSTTAPIDTAALPEVLRRQLQELEAKARNLLVEGSELAEKSVTDPAAEEAYKRNVDESIAVDAEIRRVSLALDGMAKRAAEASTAAEAAELARLQGRVVQMLDRSGHVALEIEERLAELIAMVKDFGELRKAAFNAWPGVQPTANGIAVFGPEIERLLSHEIFRQNDQPVLTGGATAEGRPVAFPGGRSPGWEFGDQPSRAPSFSAKIAEANGVARHALGGGK